MIVCCVKVGTQYGPEYVNRLAAMVARHTTRPYTFLCLTDNPTGLTCAHAPIGTDLPGWWAKLVLFQPHPALAGQRVLYLDLDTLIVGTADLLLEYDGPLAVLQDFYRPHGYGSAVMSIAPGEGAEVWRTFQANPLAVMQNHHGDQDWIQLSRPGADRWQALYPGLIVSYKVHCLEGLPEGAAVVCFHGFPKQTDLVQIPWVQEAWHVGDALTGSRGLASADAR